MIGISITAHNRPEVLERSLKEHREFLPKGAKLVIVDDASDPPIKGADFRFKHNAGIAAAKNKSIELLEGCEHIFLFDEDTWPKVKDWHLPYISSGAKHLSFTFPTLASGRANGRRLLKTRDGIALYGSPCGCMLYIHRSVVDKIGGFDVDYPQWGMEHVDYSQRAFNAKLIPYPFMDVENSGNLFHSMDQAQEVMGSTPSEVRKLTIPENRRRFQEKKNSTEKMPLGHPTDGVLLGAYFTSLPDSQRGVKWEPNPSDLQTLVDSCRANSVDFVIFHDGLSIDCKEFPKVEGPTDQASNVHRWFLYLDWVKAHPDINNIWMVDSTDVEVLRNPFQALNPNKIYSGDEVERLDNIWMRKRQQPHLSTLKGYRELISTNRGAKLFNCGLVGGSREVVLEYLEHRVRIHGEHTQGNLASTDMAVHNFILHTYFRGRVTNGLKVNTVFKRNEYNRVSYFRHK